MLEHFFLRGSLRLATAGAAVQGHVHFGMAHDRLNHSGILLLVHKERSQRMPPEVVEAESLHNFPVPVVGDPVLDSDCTCLDRSRTDVILNASTRLCATELHRRKNEVLIGCVHRFLPPSSEAV